MESTFGRYLVLLRHTTTHACLHPLVAAPPRLVLLGCRPLMVHMWPEDKPLNSRGCTRLVVALIQRHIRDCRHVWQSIRSPSVTAARSSSPSSASLESIQLRPPSAHTLLQGGAARCARTYPS